MLGQFGHPDQARIGQAHRQVFIFTNETAEISPVFFRRELYEQLSSLNSFEKGIRGKTIILQ